jgi:hypothetical protein
MISSLVTTVGASNANAYVSLAVADQYHSDRPAVGTTWSSATDVDKMQAILFATKLLDDLVEWTGWVVTETQALLWPRTGMWYRNGYSVSTTIIPTELQEATAEFARQLLVADRAADSDVETYGLESFKAGPASLSFNLDYVTAKVVPDLVVHMLPGEWYERIRGRKSGSRELLRT